MTLQQQLNALANLLLEPAITASSQFSLSQSTADINQGIAEFLGRTGLAPLLSDKYVAQTITAGLDYTLPADLAALVRMEYRVGLTGASITLPQYTFDEFDIATGAGGGLSATGAPICYREPFAGKVRFYPYPVAANVTAGDQITLYYTTTGTVLVNLTDVPNIPLQFHMAPVYYCLSMYWLIKMDEAAADRYDKKFNDLIHRAKSLIYDENQAEIFGFSEDDLASGAGNVGALG